MQTLTFKNKDLVQLIELLQILDVKKQKVVRGKAKLFKALSEKRKEYMEDFEALNKEYFEVDSEGNLKQEDGKLTFLKGADKGKANEEMKELLDEQTGVDLVEYETKVKAFFDALENDEFDIKEDVTAQDGKKIPIEFNFASFDLLMDELEQAFTKNQTKEGEDK